MRIGQEDTSNWSVLTSLGTNANKQSCQVTVGLEANVQPGAHPRIVTACTTAILRRE